MAVDFHSFFLRAAMNVQSHNPIADLTRVTLKIGYNDHIKERLRRNLFNF